MNVYRAIVNESGSGMTRETIEADYFSVNDAGSLIFWEHSPGQMPVEIQVYAPGQWSSVKKL